MPGCLAELLPARDNGKNFLLRSPASHPSELSACDIGMALSEILEQRWEREHPWLK
jgi:hypothetical protein